MPQFKCEEPLRRAYAACREAEAAFGGPPRGSADCRASEEMCAAARDIGDAMLHLQHAAARYGLNLQDKELKSC